MRCLRVDVGIGPDGTAPRFDLADCPLPVVWLRGSGGRLLRRTPPALGTIPSVPGTSSRDRRTHETRARIAEAALDLFVQQGYVETTIDQIAAAAGVGRRTVFRHFETKEAILFDHLADRREDTLARLRERPLSEPPLVSLHAVLRQHAEQGYDRQLLGQIRTVLSTRPELAHEELSPANRAFQREIAALLRERSGGRMSRLECESLTQMALGWLLMAVQAYFIEGRRSLVKTFDEVVNVCVRASASGFS
jgi:AcrR family transcriptional regulator